MLHKFTYLKVIIGIHMKLVNREAPNMELYCKLDLTRKKMVKINDMLVFNLQIKGCYFIENSTK